MIISLKNSFIFFKPMKVAGSSLESALSAVCGPEDLITGPSKDDLGLAHKSFTSQNNTDQAGLIKFKSHTCPEELFSATMSPWPGFFTISCVRNPWDLCASYYWWSVQKLFIDKGIDPRSVSWGSSAGNLNALITSDDCPAAICEKFRAFLFSPWHETSPGKFLNCIDFISSESEKFVHDRIDYYIRFENLQQDFLNLSRILGYELPSIPVLKSGYRNKKISCQDYYDQETYQIVRDKFPSFVRLGYDLQG